NRRLDDRKRDLEESDHGLERAGCPAKFERACDALFWHRSRAFDCAVIGLMPSEPIGNSKHVDPHLRAGADDRDVDRIDKLRRGAVDELYDCEAAMDSGIDAKDLHGLALPTNTVDGGGTGVAALPYEPAEGHSRIRSWPAPAVRCIIGSRFLKT